MDTYQEFIESNLDDPPRNPWSYRTFAAVGPKGQIVTRHMVPGTLGEIGDAVIRYAHGTTYLPARYKRMGWVLYEDLCLGAVPGVEGDSKAWERWRRLIELRAKGGELPSSVKPSTFWHAEVARRAGSNGMGVPQPTIAELRELFPGIEIDELSDEAKAFDAAAKRKKAS
jgi:hypothetical protein